MDIQETWKKVFPNSLMTGSKACLGNSMFYKGFLAGNHEEFANGISHNDPLSYMFEIDNGAYIESTLFISIRPDKKYLAYSSAKMRKQTIKGITPEKLEKRFIKIRDFIISHKDDFINLQFDINEKV